MGKNRVYVAIMQKDSLVASMLMHEKKLSIYEAFAKFLKDYVDNKYKDAEWTDTRFVKDGAYVDPNRKLTVNDNGIYELEVYEKQ